MTHVIKNEEQSNYYMPHFIFLAIVFFLFSSSALIATPKEDGKWVVVIDAGHGGSDPGAIGSISKEKDITLAVALQTGKYLTENLKNVKVIYTRDKDKSVDLIERPKIANRNNADLFISIHANSISDKASRNKVAGAETYIMGLAKDKASLDVAMRENEVITLEDDYSTKYEGFDPQSPESYVIFTLTHNLFQRQSTELASNIQTQFRDRVGRKDRGVKQAGYWVLYNTSMPSILIELGFISNTEEEKYMNSQQGQEYLASAIFRACRDYMNEIDSKSAISVHNGDNKTESKTTVAPAANKEETTTTASSTETAKNEAVTAPTAKKEETKKEKETVKESSSNNTISFRVQIATTAAQKAMSPENFKGHTDVSEIKEPDRYKYLIGDFDNYNDALNYRKKTESEYPDAFVVGIIDNKIVPLQQALDMKQQTTKQ